MKTYTDESDNIRLTLLQIEYFICSIEKRLSFEFILYFISEKINFYRYKIETTMNNSYIQKWYTIAYNKCIESVVFIYRNKRFLPVIINETIPEVLK